MIRHLASFAISIVAALILLSQYGECVAGQEQQAAERVRTEIPYRDGTVILLSDFQERITKTRYRAKGHVQITFQDTMLTCDEVEYDEASREGVTRGLTRFSQKAQWLNCSAAEFNFSSQTAVFHDASGFTDRQMLISGRTVYKTGRDTYKIESGFVTACQEKRPKWSMSSSRTNIHLNRTARLRNTVFRIKGVPVLYFPYVILPMLEKERSSGFMPFRYGSSNSKGREFSVGYFQALGRSADVTIYGEYFSLRGRGLGGVFRARPNRTTRLYIQAFGVSDKLNQGGAHLIVDGESLLPRDIRAVARVNITTSFDFRQAFADNFRSATVSQEHAAVFLTKNRESYSANFAFQRDEVLFPIRSLVIRKFPSFEFSSLGKPLGSTPFILYFDSSVDSLSRSDSNLPDGKIVQRLDLYPRLSVRLPALAGFSLIPTVGIRETYYTGRLAAKPEPEFLSESLNRRYADLELEIRTPTLEKNYQSSRVGNFRHVIEPVATYRRISGADKSGEILRFDETDAVFDTNEFEYGIVNRIFRNRETKPGSNQDYEFLSVALMQKYFFDPSFGGAFRPGEQNIFYPLNTLTAFSATGIQRTLSPTSLIARLSPKTGITHDVRADFDTKLQRMRDVSLSTFWQQGKVFVAGTYFKTNTLEPGTFESNHIQGQVGYGSTMQGFSASLTMSYDLRTSKLLNSHSRMNYMWDCCGISMELQQYDLGQRTETRFSFSFTLKGIGSFGNIKRPESLF